MDGAGSPTLYTLNDESVFPKKLRERITVLPAYDLRRDSHDSQDSQDGGESAHVHVDAEQRNAYSTLQARQRGNMALAKRL